MVGIMKKYGMSMIILTFIMTLAGCSKTELTKDTVTVDRKGAITAIIMDIYDKSYYDLNEVEEMAKKEISEYNQEQGRAAVTYGSVEKSDDNVVKMTIRYQDPFSYADFNHVQFFYGTVKDAFQAGYDLNVELISAKNREELIGADKILEMGDSYILITSEPLYIQLDRNIQYMSSNVVDIVNKKEADTIDDGNLIYVISK